MKIYRVVVNGGIRWNSTYLMIERAMLLKDALYLYWDDHHSETDAADYLTSEDCLYEVLTSMDFILTHLKSAKLKPTYTAAPYFKARIPSSALQDELVQEALYLIAKAASTITQQQPAMPVVSKDLNLYNAYNRLSSPTKDDEDDLQRAHGGSKNFLTARRHRFDDYNNLTDLTAHGGATSRLQQPPRRGGGTI
ncbi:hypothetical protein Q7P36_008864 [Cladosporium allicinum]